jgi:hypothetical protein
LADQFEGHSNPRQAILGVWLSQVNRGAFYDLVGTHGIPCRRNPPVRPQKLHAQAPALCVTRYRQAFFIGTRRARMSYEHLKVLTRMKLETTRPLLKMAGLTSLLCCLAVAQQSASSGTLSLSSSLSSIVQRMENAQSELRVQAPYQVIREYRLFGAKSSSANADVVAQVDSKPPTSKEYSIQKWSGSSRGKQNCGACPGS